jgi:hypothetical protein
MRVKFLKDLAYRTAATYVETVAGLAAANGFNLLDLSAWKTAAVAGLPAAAAVIKGSLAKFVGNPDQASLVDTTKEA